MKTSQSNKTDPQAQLSPSETTLRVSVVIPLGPGRDEELGRLKKILAAQTLQPLEIIIEKGLHTYSNRNRGWRKAAGEIIWFLDSDVVPNPDALEKAVEVFALSHPDGVEGHIFGKINRVFEWGFMSGHILYTREALEKAGGFDERFIDWRGDTDLGWTILDNGGRIIYQPLSRAQHPGGSGTMPDLEMERLLYDKHPNLYRVARANGYLQCLIAD